MASKSKVIGCNGIPELPSNIAIPIKCKMYKLLSENIG